MNDNCKLMETSVIFKKQHSNQNICKNHTFYIDKLPTKFKFRKKKLNRKTVISFQLSRELGSLLLSDYRPQNSATPCLGFLSTQQKPTDHLLGIKQDLLSINTCYFNKDEIKKRHLYAL